MIVNLGRAAPPLPARLHVDHDQQREHAMIWEAQHAVPGPWRWLNAEPLHRAAA